MRRFLLLFGGLFALFCGGAELKTWTFESRRDLLGELLPEYIEKNVLEVRDD